MKSYNQRVVTYLNEKYKKQLEEICKDREEKEALIVREIIKEYFDRNLSLKKRIFSRNI